MTISNRQRVRLVIVQAKVQEDFENVLRRIAGTSWKICVNLGTFGRKPSMVLPQTLEGFPKTSGQPGSRLRRVGRNKKRLPRLTARQPCQSFTMCKSIFQIPSVHALHAFLDVNLVVPAQVVELGDIRQLAHRPVRLRGVEG